MHYGARYYSPYLNRWIQPDTIVPDPANPQSLNRFSYALNNPLRYIDPTGHEGCDVNNIGACQETELIELILKGTPGWVNGFITHWLSLLRQSPTGLALINSLKEAGISWQVMFGDVAREGDAATIEQIGDGNGKDWRVIIDSEIFIRGLGAVLGSQTAPEVFLKSLTNFNIFHAAKIGHELFHIAIGDEPDVRSLGDCVGSGTCLAYRVEGKIVNELLFGGRSDNYREGSDLAGDQPGQWNYPQTILGFEGISKFFQGYSTNKGHFRVPESVIRALLVVGRSR